MSDVIEHLLLCLSFFFFVKTIWSPRDPPSDLQNVKNIRAPPTHRYVSQKESKPTKLRATVKLQRTFGWFCHVWTFLERAQTTRICFFALHCFRAAGASGSLFVQMCGSLFRLVLQGQSVVRCPLVRKDWPSQLTKGEGNFTFFWVSFFLSVWVCLFLLRARLDNIRGGLSGEGRGRRDPALQLHHKHKTQMQRRARTKTQQQIHIQTAQLIGRTNTPTDDSK